MISTGIHKHTGNVYNLSVVDNHYKQKSKKMILGIIITIVYLTNQTQA